MGQAKSYFTFSFSITEEREPDAIYDIGLSGRVYYENANIHHHGEIGVVAGTEKEARGLAEGEGVIQAPGNGGNWVVKIGDKQEIVNEDNIKLL